MLDHQGADHRDDYERHEESGDIEAADAPRDLIQQDGDKKAGENLHRHGDGDECHREGEGVPKLLVVEYLDVIRQSDKFRRVDVAKGHVLHAEPDGSEQGEYHERKHDEQTR